MAGMFLCLVLKRRLFVWLLRLFPCTNDDKSFYHSFKVLA